MESKLKENEDYELIPAPQDTQAWHVRFLTGDYIETVVQYGKISINGVDADDPLVTFTFDLISSPYPDLTEENEHFQKHVSDVLIAIIETGIEKKEINIKER